RNRGLYVIKSRGMAHSNQVRELLLTDAGIKLVDVYLGPSGALAGAARLAQEAQERAEAMERQLEVERQQRDLERRRQVLDARIAALRLEFEAEEEEIRKRLFQAEAREERLQDDRIEMARKRRSETSVVEGRTQPAGGGRT
ncbi:MAG TPA: KaiC 1, partial [Thermoanaerobaculia bacterium]|nr:KaiC 1 [Thermoanaerobaculia bacterium]